MNIKGIQRKWIIFYFLFSPLAVYSAQTPIITSAVIITVPTYNAYTFQVTATNNPTSFSATGLPSGLSINTQTGLISGSMNLQDFGSYIVNLTATNAAGTGNGAMIMFTPLNAIPPSITSPSTDQATVGIPYQYQITATGGTSFYGAQTLPPGLSIGSSTGLISGTPTVQGTYLIYFSASSQGGASSAILLLTVNPGAGSLPTITSGANSAGQVSVPYSYQISASNGFSGYMATGLAPGLSFNPSLGLISGTPTLAGNYTMLVSALNNNGSGSQAVALTISPAATQLPVITSPPTDYGIANFQGVFTPYQITATGNPTSFNATGLPPGLIFDPLTAQIYGTPSQSGTFTVTLSASNSAGTGTMSLSYKVDPAGTAPQIPSNPAPAEVRAGSVSGNPGTTVDLPIYYTPSPDVGANSLSFYVVAPPHVRLVSCGLGQTALDANFTPFCTPPVGQGGAFSVGWANLGPGLSMVVHLQIDDGIPGGTFPIHLANTSVTSQYNTVNNTLGEVIVPANAVDGTVTILGSVAPPVPMITSANTAPGVVNQAFSYTIQATNNPTSFGILGTLPTGLSLNTQTGTITGTPTNVGQTVITMTATNTGGSSNPAQLTIAIANAPPPPPVIISANTAIGQAGQSFSYSIQATNSPTSFGITGTLPAGLSLNSGTGAITGTPNTTGTAVVSMTATNGTGTSSPVTLTITINNTPPPPPVITSAQTASGVVGQPFAFTITATNTPFNFNAVGFLPTGLTLNTATGAIAGTPTLAVTSALTVSATNLSGTDAEPLTITITNPPPPVITSAGSAIGTVGQTFTYWITASNDPTSFAINGTLPSGLSLNTNTGAITGTPSAVGIAAVTMTATNAGGTSTPGTLTITINPPAPIITSAGSASGVLGQTFSYTITGTNNPTSFGITGTLPAGLSLNTGTGAITGTPTAAVTAAVMMTATNAGGASSLTPLTITIINPPPPVPSITSASSVVGIVGQTFSYMIAATNSPTSFAINGTLPLGLSLNTNTGAITGTPIIVGIAAVTMTATNAGGTSTPGTLTITINPPAPGITSAGSASGVVGQTFTYSITATNSPTSFGITGSLPSGLSLNTLTGAITGTPSTAGPASVMMTATNAGGTSAPVQLSITIVPASPVISSAGSASGVVGQVFSYTITATNNPTIFGITGSLPSDLSLNTLTGVITGTPNAAGSMSVMMTATNAGGTSNPVQLSITITNTPPPPPVITSAGSASGVVGQAFSYTISATNNPNSFGITGTLPAGLSLNTGTGAITGTPSAIGRTVVSMTATNPGGTSSPVQLTITINPAAPVITSAGSASGITGQVFSYTITATNNPTSFGITGTLPAGLSLNAGTGAITGTPNTAGPTSVMMTATNAGGTSAPVQLMITISNPLLQAPVITSALSANGTVDQPFIYQITATNSPTSFGIIGTLPAGLSLNTVTGAITGTPSTVNTSAVMMTATNSGGNATPVQLTITIAAASNTTTLPVPDISGLNGQSFLLTDQLAFSYPLSGVTFTWAFAASDLSSVDGAETVNGAPHTANAPAATTSAPRFTPASAGLTPGTYQLTVTVGQGNQTQQSAPVTINLVPSDLSGVKIYPNPWRSDQHAAFPRITFAGLAAGTTIKIFTVSAHEVKELHTDGPTCPWDLTNKSGDKVASGIYLYLITDRQGDKVRGKLAVIK